MTPPANSPILLLDIGSGTQDALLYYPDRALENCPKFVLPSPARIKAQAINQADGRPLHLTGSIMGGGFFRALKAHLERGGKVSAEPHAALSLFDDPKRTRALGVDIREDAPAGSLTIHLADYDEQWWTRLCEAGGVDGPGMVCACAQDHGFHPGSSNRLGRFKLWERFLLEGRGHPEALLFEEPPQELTRLMDLQRDIHGGPVADTGAAACLGALFTDEVRELSEQRGVTLLNLGNSHTIAFLLYAGRIHGVYEHHTGMLSAQELARDLALFRSGGLGNDPVFDSGGHGCLTLELPAEAGDFAPLYVIGPRRGMLAGGEAGQAVFPAPGGDMMLAGCFGLLLGLRLKGLAE